MFLPLQFIKNQLKAVIDEVNRIEQSEFPYIDSNVALTKIKERFVEQLQSLETIQEGFDQNAVRNSCNQTKRLILEYLPLVGFILRSTNLRIAFEMYGPLLRLTKNVLGPESSLVISSEWDRSPFTYKKDSYIDNFVLIGLPASESANPLLIPLAGHELGHSLWLKSKFYDQGSIKQSIQNNVETLMKTRWTDFKEVFSYIGDTPNIGLLTFPILLPIKKYAERQAVETFCDFVGLRIFGESFLHATAYMMSSNDLEERSLFYPKVKTRIGNLIKAAKKYKVEYPSNFLDMFEGAKEPEDQQASFSVSVSDEVLTTFIDDLIDEADVLITNSGIQKWDANEAKRIYNDFVIAIPARSSKTLPDILNAAWLAYHDKNLWNDIPQIKDRKDEVLKELVLKNIEVFEYEGKINAP